MSHFTVAVIGHTDLEKALYPYWELDLTRFEMEDDPRAIFKIEFKKDEAEKAFEDFKAKCTAEREEAIILLPKLKEFASKCEKLKGETAQVDYILTSPFIKEATISLGFSVDAWLIIESAFRLLKALQGRCSGRIDDESRKYESYEIWLDKHHGYYQGPKGDWGHYTNPNYKWDWYSIGGRWSNMLICKKEAVDKRKGPKAFDKKPVNENGFDVLTIGDIDWPEMYKRNLENNEEGWRRRWKTIMGKGRMNKDDSPMALWGYGNKEEVLKAYKDEENFVKCHAEFSTYAVITPDGKWHAKGEMGYWGCSSENEEESENWSQSFYDTFIKSFPPETPFVIIDCHI